MADSGSVMRQVGAMMSVGFEFLLTILLPGALGYWLDRRFGTGPWLILILGAFGFGVGLYRLRKSAAAATK